MGLLVKNGNLVKKLRLEKGTCNARGVFTGCSSGLLVLVVWSGKTMPSSPITKLTQKTPSPRSPLEPL